MDCVRAQWSLLPVLTGSDSCIGRQQQTAGEVCRIALHRPVNRQLADLARKCKLAPVGRIGDRKKSKLSRQLSGCPYTRGTGLLPRRMAAWTIILTLLKYRFVDAQFRSLPSVSRKLFSKRFSLFLSLSLFFSFRFFFYFHFGFRYQFHC